MRFASRSPRCALPIAIVFLIAGCGGGDGSSGVDAGDGNGNGNGEPAGSAYVDQLRLPEISGGAPTCCKDFGELSKPKIEDDEDVVDNAFAQLAKAVELFGMDIQAAMTAQIEEGRLVILFDHGDLRSETGVFQLDGFFGAFAGGTTYADARAGQGSFTIVPESLDGSGTPLIRFADASMESGSLRAGPAVVGASFPVADGAIAVQLHGTEITGEATFSEGGVTYVDGTIAGYLLLDDIFGAANDFLRSDACACLDELDGEDVFVKDGDEWTDANCQENHSCEEDSGCANLGSGGICSFLPGVLQGEADIRTDPGSSSYQGLSIGYEFSAVPGEIVD